MSGIAGIARFDDAPVEAKSLHTMTNAMIHRGPDGIEHWLSGSVALGQYMLHTTPESLTEQQPLLSEDGSLVLVLDGRVDNWEILRKELTAKGIVLRDHSDTELVMQAYTCWGEDCLAHIEGDYALVIWNCMARRLFCARDPLGNKTFNYYWNGKIFYFASELHAILALPEVPQTLNEGVLAEFLASEFYSMEETFWQNINRLPAAHQAIIDRNGMQLRRYWTPDLWATLPYTRDQDYIAHYREVFSETVRRMSRSHKPLSAEVSGGLDSSAIFAMAEHLNLRQRLLAPEVNGYTLDFSHDPDANEQEFCRAVGAFVNKKIAEVTPANPTAAWYQEWGDYYKEFPPSPNGAMGLSILEEVNARGGRVLLHGVGGDEWLGTAPTYYAEELAALRWHQVVRRLKQDAHDTSWSIAIWWFVRYGIAVFLPENIKNHIRRMRDSRPQVSGSASWLSSHLQAVLKEQRQQQFSWRGTRLRWPGQLAELNTLTRPYSSFAQESQERLAASYQVEFRSPFRTREMVQLSFMMPKRLLRAHGFNRFAHRKAMNGLLPEWVLHRQTKAEFSVVFRQILTQMEVLLTNEIPSRRSHWIEGDPRSKIHEEYLQYLADEDEFGSLWELFGCDSVAND